MQTQQQMTRDVLRQDGNYKRSSSYDWLACIGIPFTISVLFLFVSWIWGLIVTTKMVMNFQPSDNITTICKHTDIDLTAVIGFSSIEILLSKIFVIVSIVLNGCLFLNAFVNIK
jgi:hypothetical protein